MTHRHKTLLEHFLNLRATLPGMKAHSKELVHFFLLIGLTAALVFGAYWYFSVAALQPMKELEEECQNLIIKTGSDYMPMTGYIDIDYKMSQKQTDAGVSYMLSLQFYRDNQRGGRDAVERVYTNPLSRNEMSMHSAYLDMAFMKGVRITQEQAMSGQGGGRYDHVDKFENTRFGICVTARDDETFIGDFTTLKKLN